MEDKEKQTFTAKAEETTAPVTTPKKRNRIVIGVLVAVGLCLALCVGAAVGGGSSRESPAGQTSREGLS